MDKKKKMGKLSVIMGPDGGTVLVNNSDHHTEQPESSILWHLVLCGGGVLSCP